MSAVLPAYNEAENLEAVVAELDKALAARTGDYEIVIVEDGSFDGTARIADRLSAASSRVKAEYHPVNRGYGAALRSGFRAAKMDWIFFTDSDGQFVMDEIGKLLELGKDHDFVIGYRGERADPVHRRLYARLFGALVRSVLGVEVRDVNCAFKLIRRELIDRADLFSEGALINAELIAKLKARGVAPVEVEVSHRPRLAGAQTGGNPLVIARAFIELFVLWKRLRGE